MERGIKDFLDKLFYSVSGSLQIVFKADFSFKKKLKKIGSLKHGSLLRILGNGESLKNELNRLETEKADYMVLNRHVLSSDYESLKPGYYVLADSHYFNHPEGLFVLEKISEKTQWDMILFVPRNKKNNKVVKGIMSGNAFIRIVFYNNFVFSGFSWLKKTLYNSNLVMPKIQNVLAACIYIGIFLRYNIVELYGVEHSWTKNLSVNDNNEVCLENPHFYDQQKESGKTWKEIHHKDADMATVLRAYANMFDSYYELNKIAHSRHVRIVNCTKNSFIDAFERC